MSLPFPARIRLLPNALPVPAPVSEPTQTSTREAMSVCEATNLGEIYMITDKRNNKRYIGQTKCVHIKNGKEVIYGAEDRFKEHLKCAFSTNEDTRNSCPKLYTAIREVPPDQLLNTFEVVRLERCLRWDLNTRERHFIKVWKTRRGGYNVTAGGQKRRNRR